MATVKPSISLAEKRILSKIYYIREQKVMLDRDLAELYGVETKRLKEQVNRNRSRFPKHFMFELSQKEHEILRSQNATLKQGAHSKYPPYAFTEHGILMLSNVLKSERAIKMSIKIIDVFVKLREMVLSHKDILLQLEKLEKQTLLNAEDIQSIFDQLRQFLIPPEQSNRRRIGFRRNNQPE